MLLRSTSPRCTSLLLSRVSANVSASSSASSFVAHSRAFHSRSFAASSSSSSSSAASPPTIRVVHSSIRDACFNLSFEERLFASHIQQGNKAAASSTSSAPAVDHTLFLWCNSPSVIIGRHQNPYQEVRVPLLREKGVALVRRKSGGGTVYQDEGNAIFTFISRDIDGAKEQHNRILLNTLSSLGFQAKTSGRNDIELDDEAHRNRKISGCAFQREKGWLMHHGTMLLNVNFTALSSFLNPSKAKLQAKGVTSVAARVANLCEIDPSLTRDKWETRLEQTFRDTYKSSLQPKTFHISSVEDAFSHDVALEPIYTQMKSFSWIHGTTPEFTHEFTQRFERWGSVTIGFSVKAGRVENVNIFSDALQTSMIDLIAIELATLATQRSEYNHQEISRVLNRAQESVREKLGEEAATNVAELREWLLTHV